MLILNTQISWKRSRTFQRSKNKKQHSDWFNDEVANAIKLWKKGLKQFSSTKVHIDKDFY